MKRTLQSILAILILAPTVLQAQSGWADTISQTLSNKKITIHPAVVYVAAGLALSGVAYKIMQYIYRPRMVLADCPHYQEYQRALAEYNGLPYGESLKNTQAYYCETCGHTHKDNKPRKMVNLSEIKNLK